MSSSLHLSAAEFDAYLAERAGSNAYSRPRIEVKQRALVWARGVAARLAAIGITVDVHATDEHPSLRNKKRVDCQWVFFWRDEEAREELERLLDQGRPISVAVGDPSPYTRHAFLALRVDARSIEVCFAVHPDAKIDVDNLRARLLTAPLGSAGAELATELTAALGALPEQFLIGVRPEDRVSCGTVTLEAMADMLERAASGQTPLWIGWSVPRDTALEHKDSIGEQLEDALVALAPIYRLVAWSPENDHVGLEHRLAGAREQRARAHAARAAESEKWRADRAKALELSRAEARARGENRASKRIGSGRARQPTLDALFPVRPREGSLDRSAAAKGRAGSTQAPPERSRVSAQAEGRVAIEPSPSASAVLDKGTRVRVCAGPFADKLGVVSELDGRGGARVLLGLLSTRLDLNDLEPVVEGRDRPSLQSSHRRPTAPVPRKAR